MRRNSLKILFYNKKGNIKEIHDAYPTLIEKKFIKFLAKEVLELSKKFYRDRAKVVDSVVMVSLSRVIL